MDSPKSLICALAYGAYLVFQLWSHAELYEDDSADNFKSTAYRGSQRSDSAEGMSSGLKATANGSVPEKRGINPSAGNGQDVDLERQTERTEDENTEEQEEPQLSLWMAVATLAVVTVVCSG